MSRVQSGGKNFQTKGTYLDHLLTLLIRDKYIGHEKMTMA